MRALGSLLVLSLFATSTWAKQFSNQYCQFELPNGWECSLEGSEWVCQSENADRKKEAIIILAAKIRGEQDTIDEYDAYLKKPKTYSLPGGKVQVSEAKYTKRSDINQHQWIDALHLASEVPGFYTRYLATVKEDLGVAVTFSVGKDQYANYQAMFDAAIASLRVFRQKNAAGEGYQVSASGEDLADTTFVPDSEKVDISMNATKDRKKKAGGDDSLLYIIVGVGAAIGFVIMKGKKKKK